MGPALSPTGARSLGADGRRRPAGTKDPAAPATGTEAAGIQPAPPTCGRNPLAWAQKSCGLCQCGAGVFRCQEKATVFPFPVNDPGWLARPLSPLHVFPCWTLTSLLNLFCPDMKRSEYKSVCLSLAFWLMMLLVVSEFLVLFFLFLCLFSPGLSSLFAITLYFSLPPPRSKITSWYSSTSERQIICQLLWQLFKLNVDLERIQVKKIPLDLAWTFSHSMSKWSSGVFSRNWCI